MRSQMMGDGEEVVAAAEGYFGLKLYEEALRSLESLAPPSNDHPRVLRVRAACAFATRNFELAQILVLRLEKAPQPYTVFAARLLHELAAIHRLMGDTLRSRQLICHAIRILPDQRLAILEDRQLEGLL